MTHVIEATDQALASARQLGIRGDHVFEMSEKYF